MAVDIGALRLCCAVLTCAALATCSRATPTPTPKWLITPGGIGDLRIGDALPARVAGPELLAQYTTTFYADAQPLEGFTFSDPPVFAAASGGPFARWGMQHPGEAAPEAMRRDAVRLARAGKLAIEMLVITDPRPSTANGAFVSQGFTAFARAYPGVSRNPMPALWEEPSCVAQQGSLWFFFDHCGADETAKIIRIVVRKDRA
jgi:hypothetical protein